MEKVGRGEIVAGEDFPKIWNEFIEAEENRMILSWIDRPLVPLEKSTPEFQLKKYQCQLAVESRSGRTQSIETRSLPRKTKKHEVWLETQDGTVGGYVDAILSTDHGEIIVDYKTGHWVRTKAFRSETNRIHEDQLKLYAALYYKAYDKWPLRLEIIGIDGSINEVEFTQDACFNLLDEANNFRTYVNQIISDESDPIEIQRKLSNPDPMICRSCLHRPACTFYWEHRDKNPELKWPNDAIGVLKEKKFLGNNLILVKLSNSMANSGITAIRGLHRERHPALENRSNRHAIFSMASDRMEDHFKEGQLTTIYCVR